MKQEAIWGKGVLTVELFTDMFLLWKVLAYLTHAL